MADKNPEVPVPASDDNNSGSSGGKGTDAYATEGPTRKRDDGNSGSTGGKGTQAYPVEGK